MEERGLDNEQRIMAGTRQLRPAVSVHNPYVLQQRSIDADVVIMLPDFCLLTYSTYLTDPLCIIYGRYCTELSHTDVNARDIYRLIVCISYITYLPQHSIIYYKKNE